MTERLRAALGLVALAAALAAPAAAGPAYSAKYDHAQRVRTVDYQDNLVLRVVGYGDHPMMIEVGEPITDAAGGAIANWEITRRGNRLFVRPLAGARATTVVAATKTRSYVLDLVPGGGGRGMPADFVSKIIVQYPPSESELTAKAAADAKASAERALKERTPLTEALAGPRNSSYTIETVSMPIDIRPREVFDDKRFTYFKFPENLPVPAIYKSTPGTQEEWLVNSHRDGDYIVMHGISPLWNLRLSGSVLGVFNEAFDPVGKAAADGSNIHGLKRVVR